MHVYGVGVPLIVVIMNGAHNASRSLLTRMDLGNGICVSQDAILCCGEGPSAAQPRRAVYVSVPHSLRSRASLRPLRLLLRTLTPLSCVRFVTSHLRFAPRVPAHAIDVAVAQSCYFLPPPRSSLPLAPAPPNLSHGALLVSRGTFRDQTSALVALVTLRPARAVEKRGHGSAGAPGRLRPSRLHAG